MSVQGRRVRVSAGWRVCLVQGRKWSVQARKWSVQRPSGYCNTEWSVWGGAVNARVCVVDVRTMNAAAESQAAW